MTPTGTYAKLTVADIRKGLSARDFSAEELTVSALELARKRGKELNCFITLCDEKAVNQARAVDAKIKSGAKLGPLAGASIALKDNLSYRDYLTSCGSHILDGYKPPYDATVVTSLIESDAIIIGKTNMDEFAMGSSNENSHYGPVKNPVDVERVPGGSSGGSAVSVAAGITPLSLGSETGGSVRQPASFCGLYGLKPTYGAVSRYGLVAFASSLDQIGPFARNIDDLTALYSVIAGRDPNDSTSVAYDHPNYTSYPEAEKKFTIGLPKECFAHGVDDEIVTRIDELKSALTKAAHKLVDVSLPLLDAGVATYYIVATAEASANLARFDGVRYGLSVGAERGLIDMYRATRGAGFGEEVKRRIMLGTYVLSSGYYDAYYLKGMRVRELIRRDLDAVFKNVDLLLTPTTPTPAFKIGEKVDDPIAMYLSDIFTVMCNLSGTPGLSVPLPTVSKGLPCGAQFISPHFQEHRLFAIAKQIEKIYS